MNEIQEDDLFLLKGCTYFVAATDNVFEGTVEPGCRCLVKCKDPETHEHLWGSIAGAFRFTRTGDWREEIPEHWLNGGLEIVLDERVG